MFPMSFLGEHDPEFCSGLPRAHSGAPSWSDQTCLLYAADLFHHANSLLQTQIWAEQAAGAPTFEDS